MLLLLLASAPAAAPAETGRPSLGLRLALEGRCAAALPELERERAADPHDAELALRLGQCALRQKEYGRAATALEAALALDAESPDAWLDLARARYHADEPDAAHAALERAPQPERALWQLYRGLVDLARGDAAAAVAALEQAVALDAGSWRSGDEREPVQPMASYYLGVAQGRAGQAESAARTLQGVAEDWSGTGWGDQARASLQPSPGRRAFLTLGAGYEYDDNVLLAGSGAALPEDISGESGARGIWQARGGVDIGRWGATSAGALASYSGRSHVEHELHDFDTHFPSGTLWLDHALVPRTHLRGSYTFGHAWVHSEPYLVAHEGDAALLHAWSDRQTSSLTVRLLAHDYKFRPDDDEVATPDPEDDESRWRNRDGWGPSVGVAHAVALPLGLSFLPDPALRGGYVFTRFFAEGREYEYDGHRLFAGLAFALPRGATLDLEGGYEHRLYDHATSFEDSTSPRRRDDIFSAGTRLSVPIAGPVSVSVHYRFRDSDSNVVAFDAVNVADVRLFDYDQHVVGFLLNLTLASAR